MLPTNPNYDIWIKFRTENNSDVFKFFTAFETAFNVLWKWKDKSKHYLFSINAIVDMLVAYDNEAFYTKYSLNTIKSLVNGLKKAHIEHVLGILHQFLTNLQVLHTTHKNFTKIVHILTNTLLPKKKPLKVANYQDLIFIVAALCKHQTKYMVNEVILPILASTSGYSDIQKSIVMKAMGSLSESIPDTMVNLFSSLGPAVAQYIVRIQNITLLKAALSCFPAIRHTTHEESLVTLYATWVMMLDDDREVSKYAAQAMVRYVPLNPKSNFLQIISFHIHLLTPGIFVRSLTGGEMYFIMNNIITIISQFHRWVINKRSYVIKENGMFEYEEWIAMRHHLEAISLLLLQSSENYIRAQALQLLYRTSSTSFKLIERCIKEKLDIKGYHGEQIKEEKTQTYTGYQYYAQIKKNKKYETSNAPSTMRKRKQKTEPAPEPSLPQEVLDQILQMTPDEMAGLDPEVFLQIPNDILMVLPAEALEKLPPDAMEAVMNKLQNGGGNNNGNSTATTAPAASNTATSTESALPKEVLDQILQMTPDEMAELDPEVFLQIPNDILMVLPAEALEKLPPDAMEAVMNKLQNGGGNNNENSTATTAPAASNTATSTESALPKEVLDQILQMTPDEMAGLDPEVFLQIPNDILMVLPAEALEKLPPDAMEAVMNKLQNGGGNNNENSTATTAPAASTNQEPDEDALPQEVLDAIVDLPLDQLQQVDPGVFMKLPYDVLSALPSAAFDALESDIKDVLMQKIARGPPKTVVEEVEPLPESNNPYTIGLISSARTYNMLNNSKNSDETAAETKEEELKDHHSMPLTQEFKFLADFFPDHEPPHPDSKVEDYSVKIDDLLINHFDEYAAPITYVWHLLAPNADALLRIPADLLEQLDDPDNEFLIQQQDLLKFLLLGLRNPKKTWKSISSYNMMEVKDMLIAEQGITLYECDKLERIDHYAYDENEVINLINIIYEISTLVSVNKILKGFIEQIMHCFENVNIDCFPIVLDSLAKIPLIEAQNYLILMDELNQKNKKT